jgi:5-methylcytosine-specific restriction endonuclease McrA
VWREKRDEIRERDMFGCVCCQKKIHDLGKRQFDTEGIEVHHIIPLVENFDLRLDDDNLISLCREHHELAEKGTIDREVLLSLVHK